jgi:hypothetical protein
MTRKLVSLAFLLTLGFGSAVYADSRAEFQRTFALAPTDHIILDVAVPNGDVTISYTHAGEISVAAIARAPEGKDLPADFFAHRLVAEREGDHIKIQFNAADARFDESLRISYTIGVPNWIEVNSSVGNGKQTIAGVMGPVRVVSGSGDVKVSYVTDALEAKTGSGNITVIRVGAAAKVETGLGNINLKDIGPGSVATVKKGTGRIEVDGISGTFTGSTDAGDLEVKGGVHDGWDLKSASGNIRIGPSSESKFEIDAATRSGKLLVENEDIEMPEGTAVRACRQKVNGGGKLVRARSTSGSIFIQ